MADRMRVPRKEKMWGSILGQSLAMTADGTFGVAGTGFSSSQTVLRMLGEYLISATGTILAGDAATITCAIGKISSDAFALGPTAWPDPAGEPDYPWLYWASHPVRWPEGGAPVQGREIPGVVRHSFDIRTMRKFKPRETLVFVAQYADRVGTPPVTLEVGQIRVLMTIH